MKNKIIKGITLIVFVSLIAGFVLYKSGYFIGQKVSHSVNSDGSTLKNTTNSPPQLDSLESMEMMSSSKSLILASPSISKKKINSTELDTSQNNKRLMPSSKTGIILDAEDLKQSVEDSINME